MDKTEFLTEIKQILMDNSQGKLVLTEAKPGKSKSDIKNVSAMYFQQQGDDFDADIILGFERDLGSKIGKYPEWGEDYDNSYDDEGRELDEWEDEYLEKYGYSSDGEPRLIATILGSMNQYTNLDNVLYNSGSEDSQTTMQFEGINEFGEVFGEREVQMVYN